MRVIISGLLLCLTSSLFAQGDFRNGYIIKVNGDSLTGWVVYPTTKNSSRVCIYRETLKSKSVKFSPKELLVYGIFEGKRFESKTITRNGTSDIALLEVLVKGELSLYTSENIFYYEQDTLMELPSVRRSGKLYVGILNLILDECNLRADETDYKQRDLVNLVQNYNRCLGEAGLVYKRNLPWTQFNYEITGGIALSTMRMDYYGNINFAPSTGGFLGGGIDISMPRINEKFFISMELNYYKSLFQGYKENLQSTSIRNDVIMDMSLLQLPLGVRFIFLSDNNTSYIEGGFITAVNVGSSYKIITEQESGGTVITSVVDEKLDSRTQMGFWMSAGYQRGVKGRYKIYVETRLEKRYGYFYGQFQAPIENNNVNVSVGFRY